MHSLASLFVYGGAYQHHWVLKLGRLHIIRRISPAFIVYVRLLEHGGGLQRLVDSDVWVCAQTARYLVKQLLAARAGKAGGVGSADYTNNAEAELRQRCPVASSRDWLDPAVQSAAFRCPPPHA